MLLLLTCRWPSSFAGRSLPRASWYDLQELLPPGGGDSPPLRPSNGSLDIVVARKQVRVLTHGILLPLRSQMNKGTFLAYSLGQDLDPTLQVTSQMCRHHGVMLCCVHNQK